jgi:hypothetical protein
MAHAQNHRVVVLAALALPLVAFADRPPQSRDKATHVVVARVEAVYAQEGATGANQQCVVEVTVEKVERGGGLKAGTALYACIYRPNPNAPDLKKMTERDQERYLLTVDGGHDPAPRPGSRVRVFLIHSAGRYTGVFHRWVDILKDQ